MTILKLMGGKVVKSNLTFSSWIGVWFRRITNSNNEHFILLITVYVCLLKIIINRIKRKINIRIGINLKYRKKPFITWDCLMVLPILFLCDKPNACWFYLLHKIFNSIRNPFYCSHYTLFSSLIKRDIETATTRRQKSIYHAQCRSFWLCTSQGICSNSIIVWEEPFKWSTLLLCLLFYFATHLFPHHWFIASGSFITLPTNQIHVQLYDGWECIGFFGIQPLNKHANKLNVHAKSIYG